MGQPDPTATGIADRNTIVPGSTRSSQVLQVAETNVDEVVLAGAVVVVFFGSVLDGTEGEVESVVAAWDVVVVVAPVFDVFGLDRRHRRRGGGRRGVLASSR